MASKSEPIDLSNLNNGNLAEVLSQLENKIPNNAVLLDKTLLPSRGRYYPEDIYVKKLSTLNVKNLATIDEKNIMSVINGVLKSCLFGIDVNKILVGDKVWIIFYLRAYTYNDIPFKIRGKCDHCESILTFDYRLENLQVQYLEEDLPEFFQVGDDKVKVKFPTISTETEINKLKTNEQVVEDLLPDVLDMASYFVELNGKPMTLIQAYRYILNLDAVDFSKLTNDLNPYIFNAFPYAKFTCPICGEEVTLPIAFVPSFFLPKEV